MFKNIRKSEKGFTLIELLIVIVIIGILAGVLISVLNPVQQQNKARDASVRATINKMALSTKGLSAASTTGNVPTPAEFFTGVSNRGLSDCDTTTGATCYIYVDGVNLPDDCSANNAYNGDGTGTCAINYFYDDGTGGNADNSFRIAVKTHAEPRGIYVYAYEQTSTGSTTDEGLFFCTDETFSVAYGGSYDTVADLRADTTNCTSQL